MAKFLSVLLNDEVDSGTTTATTANKLVNSGQNFLSTVSVGDIIMNTTSDVSAVVTAIDSNTTLSITPDVMPTGQDYVIYSYIDKTEQLIGIKDAILVKQTGTISATITMSSGSASGDVITIAHTPIAATSVSVRQAIQNALLKANDKKHEPEVKIKLEMPTGVIPFGISIG
jgi:hypothetical protein